MTTRSSASRLYGIQEFPRPRAARPHRRADAGLHARAFRARRLLCAWNPASTNWPTRSVRIPSLCGWPTIPTTDAISKLPFSSRHVGECLRRGAERFGWGKRTMAPQSMRADDGSLIGWGVAIGAYPCFIVPPMARLKVTDDGGVFISIGGHEMGQGIRTALAAAVGRKLGVPAAKVVAVIGDTRAAPQHLTAGSWGTASAIPAADDAADAMLKALAELSPGPPGRTPAQILKAAGRASLEVEVQKKGSRANRTRSIGRLSCGLLSLAGPGLRGIRHLQLHRALRGGARSSRRHDVCGCRASSASPIAGGS